MVARRNGPVPPARHDQLAAGSELDRHRRTARVAQLLAAAARTLRAGRHVMLHDRRAQQVEADDVIAQVRAKARWRSLSRSRRLRAGCHSARTVAGPEAKRRRSEPGPRSRSALTSRLRFMRSARQVQQAPLPGLNTGPTRGKMPEGWTSSQGVRSDRCCRFNSAKSSFEIVAHQRDRQVGGALRRRERPAHAGRRRVPLRPARRSIECGHENSGDFSQRSPAAGRGSPNRRATAPAEERDAGTT